MRGGPWAPPPRLFIFLGLWVRFVFSLGSAKSQFGFVCPSRPDPCNILGLFFSRCLFFLFAVLVLLLFISPGTGGTQNILWLVFPLVSLRPRLRPVLLHLQLLLGHHPHLFFRRLSGDGGSRSVLGVLGLSLYLHLSLSLSGPFCTECMHILLRERERGWPTGRRPQKRLRRFWLFQGMSMGQCPGRSVQDCPCSPHFPWWSFKTEAGRGSGGATVLSCKCLCVYGGLYCHANACFSSPWRKGKCCPFFRGLILVLCLFFG